MEQTIDAIMNIVMWLLTIALAYFNGKLKVQTDYLGRSIKQLEKIIQEGEK